MQHWPVFLLLFLSFSLQAQDERYYRQMLAGDLPQFSDELKESPVSPISIDGPHYNIDLNGDGILESVRPAKREGIDYVIVQNAAKTVVFEGKMLAMGGESTIYKMRFVHLSKNTKALVIFLDEGATHGLQFESTARIFVLTWDNDDFGSMKLSQGPHFYHEKEKQRDQYWSREYQVGVRDLNNDGTREIIVHYNHIQRIMQYKGKGEWERL